MKEWNKRISNSLFILSVIVIPLSLAGWFGFKSSVYQKENRQQDEKIKTLNEGVKEIIYSRIFEFEAEGYSLKGIRVANPMQDTFQLDQLIQRATLVFRFHEGSCNPCLKENLEYLRKHGNGIPVIMLASFHSHNSFLQFVSRNNLENIYRITNTNAIEQLEMENFQLPYYFISDKDLTMRKILIAIKGYHAYNQSYLEKAKDWIN